MKGKAPNPAVKKATRNKPSGRSSAGGRKLMAALDDILAAERGEPGRVIVHAVEFSNPGSAPAIHAPPKCSSVLLPLPRTRGRGLG